MEDLPRQAREALAKAQSFSGDDLAQILWRFVDLADGSAGGSDSLEDLANWLEGNLGPLLSDDFGPEAEARRKAEIKKGARSVIDAALAKRGIGAPVAKPARQSAPGDMTRHLLFWQNFTADTMTAEIIPNLEALGFDAMTAWNTRLVPPTAGGEVAAMARRD